MDKNDFQQEVGLVTTLVLINGVNVIGKVAYRGEGAVWLHKPLAWLATPAGDDPRQWRMQMGPYFPGVIIVDTSKPFPFKDSHIMHELLPSEGLVSPYVKATSGIILAGANSLPT